MYGNEHTSTAGTLLNLGNLASERGDYPAAHKYYEDALAISRKVLGNEHTSTADILNNLGILARHQNDYLAACAIISKMHLPSTERCSEPNMQVPPRNAQQLGHSGPRSRRLFGQPQVFRRSAVHLPKSSLASSIQVPRAHSLTWASWPAIKGTTRPVR